MKQSIIFFILLILALPGISQNIPQNGSAAFYFNYTSHSQNTILNLDIMNNRSNMDILADGISRYRRDITEHEKYISLVPCIRKDQIDDARAVNRASLQASVIRAVLKLNYEIPHSCIAFAIDTTQNMSNVVMVNIFDGPLPQGDNSGIIHYILNGNPENIFSKYTTGIPYGNLWMIQTRGNNKN